MLVIENSPHTREQMESALAKKFTMDSPQTVIVDIHL